MRNHIKTIVASSALILAVGLGSAAIAGGTIGGQPGNGGGTTFLAPGSFSSVLGGRELTEAIASGDPARVEVALQAAINASFPDDVDLSPFPGQTGEQSVATLTNLIQNFALAIGLDLTSPAILRLLRIAQTAIT